MVASGWSWLAGAGQEISDAVLVRGYEKLVWDYELQSREAASPNYVAFVDGNQVELQGVSCVPGDAELRVTCNAPLPALSPGVHTIEVAAQIDGSIGPRSGQVRVRLEPLEVGQEWTYTTDDQLRLQARVIAVGLEDATDLTLVADGRLLVAERSGRIRMIRDGRLEEQPIGQIDDSDLVTGDGRGLLALTAGSFATGEQAVYVVYTSSSAARLARFTLHGDTLVGPAVLLDNLPVSRSDPATDIRFGPDRKLYLALDNGGDPGRADDLGSYAGKVLRLNDDGTTPTDQGSTSPVYATGVHRPGGIAWQSSSTWIASRDGEGGEWVYELRPDQRTRRSTIVAQHRLPDGTGARDLATCELLDIDALRGNLLVAALDGRSIVRLRPQAGGGFTTESLFANQLGGVRALAAAPGGTLYVLIGNALAALSISSLVQ